MVPVLIVNQRLRRVARGGEFPPRRSGDTKQRERERERKKKEETGKNDNEYFNKPRPIYFGRDYARRRLRLVVVA